MSTVVQITATTFHRAATTHKRNPDNYHSSVAVMWGFQSPRMMGERLMRAVVLKWGLESQTLSFRPYWCLML